tara:strand:- start:443 stop:739 length:297 start_codon:yes stop_codon:yes gene_type:complete
MNNLISFLTTNLGIIVLFGIIYMIYIKFGISSNPNEEFNGLNSESTLMDFLYFSFTIQSTVGFGDITPKTKIARVLVMCQQFTLLYGLDIIKKFVIKN